MTRNLRALISVLCFCVLALAGFYLAERGAYGWTLFVMLPSVAGGLGCWTVRSKTLRNATATGAVVGFGGCFLFLLMGREGWICVLMAIPVVVPLAIVGSWLAYWAGVLTNPRRPAAVCMLLPVSLLFDVNAKPPVYSVTTSMVVNATPEKIWKYVVAFPDIGEAPDWVLGTGVAYPIRTRIAGTGIGSPRNCDLSTGTLDERVVIWDEPRVLRFVVISTPAAMTERGLYGPISPKHVHGYYIGRAGQFEMTPLAEGKTLVTGTSWYQHGLWPAGYWRLWSDLVVHHVHRRVLTHIRELAEQEAPRG
jgi:hypothetical protein